MTISNELGANFYSQYSKKNMDVCMYDYYVTSRYRDIGYLCKSLKIEIRIW